MNKQILHYYGNQEVKYANFIGDYEEIIVTSFGDHEPFRSKTRHAHTECNDQYT
jgi:hypothetical protein